VYKKPNHPELTSFWNSRFVNKNDSVLVWVDTTESGTYFGRMNKENPLYSLLVEELNPYAVKAIHCKKKDTTFYLDRGWRVNRLSRNQSSISYYSTAKRTPRVTLIDCEAGTKTTLKIKDKVYLDWLGADEQGHYYRCYRWKRLGLDKDYILKVSERGSEILDYKNYEGFKLHRYTSDYQIYYKTEDVDCGLSKYTTKVLYRNVEIDQFDYVSKRFREPQLNMGRDKLNISWYQEYEKHYKSGKYSHHVDLIELSKKIRLEKINPDHFEYDSLYTYAIYTLDISQKLGLETVNGNLQTVNGISLQKESEEYQIIALFRKEDFQFLYYPRVIF
jgi:hypothetical protein